jgi:hypothetical protein
MNKSIIIYLLICLFSVAACTNEAEQWEKVKSKNTAAAYNKFIKKYPDSQRIPEAKGLLSRLIITELNNVFGIKTEITDEKVETFTKLLEQETCDTTLNSPVEYYEVRGNSCEGNLSKKKEIIEPQDIGKTCSLQLQLGDLAITAFYSSNSSIEHPLFPDKLTPTMTHNGCSGPGLELGSESQAFLEAFAIEYHSIDGGSGSSVFVIPDLIWGADQTVGNGHNGRVFENYSDTIKIEGLKCDITRLPEAKMNYQLALEIKTYIQTFAGELK